MKLVLVLTLAFAAITTAQDTSEAHIWHGLTLDSTTQAEADSILGKPAKIGGAKLFLRPVDALFRKGVATSLPSATYSNVAGMKRVQLFFDDDKLAAIELEPETRIDAASLPHIYGIAFEHLSNHPNLPPPPGGGEPTYSLSGSTDRATVLAEIASPLLSRGAIRPDEWPGKVIRIELISHRLDRRDDRRGADILK
jgi:hypothetical protein